MAQSERSRRAMAAIEANAERRAARGILAIALGCVLVGLLGLATPWYTTLNNAGRVTEAGLGNTAGRAAAVFALLGVVLLVVAVRRPGTAAWSGLAAAATGIAAVTCAFGIRAATGPTDTSDGFTGGAPWVGAFAFGAAALLAALCCRGAAEVENAPLDVTAADTRAVQEDMAAKWTPFVAARDDQRRQRPLVAAMLVSALVAVLALFAPWSTGDGYSRDAFGRAGALGFIGLATVALAVVLLAAFHARQQRGLRTALRGVCGVGAVVGAFAAATVPTHNGNGIAIDHASAPGPLVHVAALVALVALAGWLPFQPAGRSVSDDDTAPMALTRATVPVVVGLFGLLMALAGLVTPWLRVSSSALRTLADSAAVDAPAFELSTTPALRVVVLSAAGLALVAAVLLVAVPRVGRAALCVVLTAGGVATAVLALPDAAAADVHGVNASAGAGVGPWLCVIGGLLAALAGLGVASPQLALLRTHRRSATAVGAVAVSVLALAPLPGRTPAHAADAPAAAQIVFAEHSTSADDEQPMLFGEPARAQAVDNRGESPSNGRNADVISTARGTFFVGGDLDLGYHEVLVQQIVHGRALPVTVLSTADDVTLLTTVGDRLLVQDSDYERPSVQSVDMHQGYNSLSYQDPAAVGHSSNPAVLLRADGSLLDEKTVPHVGSLPGRDLDVQLGPDGAAQVSTYSDVSYRVDAAQVRSGRPWLGRATARATVPGPDGTSYGGNFGKTLIRFAANGTARTIAAAASDARCSLSRDPFSSYALSGVSFAAPQLAVDAAGDVWLALVYAGHAPTRLVVLTPDGVLRRPAGSWSHAAGVELMPDGSLIVATNSVHKDRTGAVYRLPDAVAAARAATPLPPVPHDCVSDYRARPATAHRAVTRTVLPALPTSAYETPNAVIATDGTRIYVAHDGKRATLVRLRRDGHRSTVYRSTSGHGISNVVADGRGGAWWTEFYDSEQRIRLGHIGAGGDTTLSVPITVANPQHGLDLVPDTGDASLWWHGGSGDGWHRTSTDGRTRSLGVDLGYTGYGAAPVVRDGHGFLLGDHDVVDAVTSSAVGDAVLGGGTLSLNLPAAVAGAVARTDYATDGTLGIDGQGRLLLYQGGYLARFGGGSAPATLLSGPADHLPQLADIDTIQVIGHTLVSYDDATTMWTVDVS